jgi:hypothetical protein
MHASASVVFSAQEASQGSVYTSVVTGICVTRWCVYAVASLSSYSQLVWCAETPVQRLQSRRKLVAGYRRCAAVDLSKARVPAQATSEAKTPAAGCRSNLKHQNLSICACQPLPAV